jgi:hypothetical protein
MFARTRIFDNSGINLHSVDIHYVLRLEFFPNQQFQQAELLNCAFMATASP